MKRFQLAGLVLALSVMALCFSAGRVHSAVSLSPDWLGTQTPAVQEVSDLPDDQEPFSMGYDCTPTDFQIGLHNDDGFRHGCVFSNALGTVTADSLVNGPNGSLYFNYRDTGFVFPSPPDHPGLVMSAFIPSSGSGDIIRMSTHDGMPVQFTGSSYRYQLDSPSVLQDQTGAYMGIAHETVAYSQNGDWMAAYVVNKGIIVYNTETFNYKFIAWDKMGNKAGAETKGENLAVSDDGRFVASNPTDRNGNPTLRVYDTTTCQDQYLSDPSSANNCEYRDIWNGVYRDKPAGTALKDLVDVEYPRHLRFRTNQALEFDGVHDRVSDTDFKVSRYQTLVMAVDKQPYLGLLGMGDSYISGEGAFAYRAGTDTANDKCHTSWLSYPYTKGQQYFSQVKSVACSGAKINDIDAGLWSTRDTSDEIRSNYKGQVLDDVRWRERSNSISIKNSFIPGYANQILFSDQYHPRNVLLSIGGNDIHFADIIKQCVSPQNGDTCYASYEDRYELMQDIVGQYDSLVRIYKDVAASSGGNVYVVGYPQIAKVGGSCGANVNLNSDEVKFSADLITYFNSIIKRAASSAGVFYVDNENALSGYKLCEAPKNKTAINGLTTGKDNGLNPFGKKIFFIGNESYHPTAFGHKLLGDSIVAKTSNFTKPMPTGASLSRPSVNLNDTLLQDVPRLGRSLNTIIWRDSVLQSPLLSGSEYVFNSTKSALSIGAHYVLTLHSSPITLSSGTVENKDLLITVPANVPSGVHTLDLYGTDDAGNAIDERQVVYISTLENLQNKPCLNIPLSRQDADNDGTDDACDGNVIDANFSADDPVNVPDEDLSVDEGPTEGFANANDILTNPVFLQTTKETEGVNSSPAIYTASSVNPRSVMSTTGSITIPFNLEIFTNQFAEDASVLTLSTATSEAKALSTIRMSDGGEGKSVNHYRASWLYMILVVAVITLALLYRLYRSKSATM